MNAKLTSLGWRAFRAGGSQHYWRTFPHMKRYWTACGISELKDNLARMGTYPKCQNCLDWMTLYAIADPDDEK